jgi:hypothetical protein
MASDRKKRCFVISPIGPEGSAVREHADEVFDFIIKPALESCNIEAFRSDHLREPGKISDQMFKAILNEDMCIAVLTGYNPNVFYELAIAQAAARPTIVLIEKGQLLPFDIHDLRCVPYDLRLRSFAQRTYINEIIAHVGAITSANWTVPPPFGVQPPLGGSHHGEEPLFFAQALDRNPGCWLESVQGASERIDVFGISLGFLRSGKGVSETLIAKANNGCKVRILFMHKDNPGLRELLHETETQRRYEPKVRDIDNSESHFGHLQKHSPNIEVRRMRRGCPFVTATRTEEVAMFIQHFYSEKLRYCPLWECRRGSRLHELLGQEFEALWHANAQSGPAAGTM